MSKQFENILNECLERMLEGETLEQCLGRYPQQAAELEPLLRVAMATRELLAICPRPEFKAKARYEFRAAMQEATAKKKRSAFLSFPRWASVTAAVAGFLMVASGTVAAAGNSMPDSPLYPVKLTAETVRMNLTLSKQAKAELNMAQAEQRVVEIAYMANKGDAKKVEELTERLDKRLTVLASLVSKKGEIQTVANAPAPAAARAPSVVPTPIPAPAVPSRIYLESPKPSDNNGNDKKAVTKAPKDVAKEASGLDEETIRLKLAVVRYAVNHPAALKTMLENVPESSRQALRHAIAVLENGYEKALRALEESQGDP